MDLEMDSCSKNSTIKEGPQSFVGSKSPDVKYTKGDLVPAESLESVVSTSKFRIVHHYCSTVSELQLMSVNVLRDELFQLKEEICEVVEDEKVLETIPSVNDVVLAPKDKKLKYHRGLVLNTLPGSDVLLYFVDVGGSSIVKFKDLKPVNSAIMQFPILGYRVILDGMNEKNCKLILRSAIEMKMQTFQKLDWDVALSDEHEQLTDSNCSFTERKTVKLTRKRSFNTICVNDDIKQLAVWEWNRCLGIGFSTDNELWGNGRCGQALEEYSTGLNFVEDIDIGTKFTAQVSSIGYNENISDLESRLVLIFADIPELQNFSEVLNNQMESYSISVRISRFNPGLNEYVMFQFTNQSTADVIGDATISANSWYRGLRLYHDTIYLFDVDKRVVFGNLCSEEYIIRRLYGEFQAIPCLSLTVHPLVNASRISFKEAEGNFKLGSRYSFTVSRSNEDGSYDVEFKDLI